MENTSLRHSRKSSALVALACLVLFAGPLWGQVRTFHASPIDEQQNTRLDTIESRQTLYEAVMSARIAALEQAQKPVQAVEKEVEPPATVVFAETPKILSVDPLTGVEVTKSAVIMISTKRCKFCVDWWGVHPTPLRNVNWQVEKVTGNFNGVELYPTFRVYDSVKNKWSQFQGFMTMSDLKRLIGREQPATQEIRSVDLVTNSRYTTEELQGMIASMRPGGWRGPVYADVQPRSQAKQHLVGPEHGFSWDQVSGLTQNEALILHDLAPRHGNKIFPYRSGAAPQRSVTTKSVVMQVAEASGCPNGDCSRSYTTRRAFRFFR